MRRQRGRRFWESPAKGISGGSRSRGFWKEDGWLYHATGVPIPDVTVPAPALAPHPWDVQPLSRVTFDRPELPLEFQWLRSPYPDELFSLTERPGI